METIQKVLWLLLIMLAIVVVFRLTATTVIAEDQITMDVATMPPLSIKDKVGYYAKKYSVSESVMDKVIKCESGYNPNANAHTSREDSWGLVQINLKAHKTITKEQAIDPDFALNFLAENLARNNGRIWTCFRKIK